MTDVNAVLDANRTAVNDLIVAAERSGEAWTLPRAPGKWSPCQVVEHVALALEESANVASGAPSKFPTFPSFLRPIVKVFFKRVLRKNEFPKAKTSKAFDPVSGPATPDEARARLDAALGKFDQACRARAASGQKVASPIFGTVPVEDFARFQALHTRHHCKQMPGAQ
ncbi:MAG: DinB family protein [Acidobacteria bacterium]|nr:DinB family protein [Acidobacteriota bacterium]